MGIGPKSTVKEFRSDPLSVVWIYPKAYYLMSLWAKLAGKQSYEFTCLGRAIEEDGNIIVTDAYAVKHEGTSGGVDMDDDAQIKLMLQLDSEGFDGELVDTKGRVDPSEIRCWTHSHPGSGPQATFWSSIDDACIDRFLTGNWCVSIVFDQDGQNPKCRIDSKSPRMQITCDLQIYLPYLTNSEEKKGVALFKETSSKKSYMVQSPYAHQRHGQYGNYQNVYQSQQGGYRHTARPGFEGVYNPGDALVETTPSKPKVKADAPKADVDTSSGLKNRIMSLFSLREEQVEEDWITWCKESNEEFGDLTGGDALEEEDEWVLTNELSGYEGQLAAFEDEGGSDVPASALYLGMDGGVTQWEELTEVDSDGNEVTREVHQGGFAEDHDGEPTLEASADEGDDIELDVDVRHDTVPNSTVSDRMNSHAVAAGLDRLAQSVVDDQLTVEDALNQAQANHNITSEQAEAALAERLGV